jgi:hypothetical protein
MNPVPGIPPVFPSNCPAMKRTSRFVLGALCAGLLLLPAVPAWAQSNAKPPTQMTYQGFLTDELIAAVAPLARWLSSLSGRLIRACRLCACLRSTAA